MLAAVLPGIDGRLASLQATVGAQLGPLSSALAAEVSSRGVPRPDALSPSALSTALQTVVNTLQASIADLRDRLPRLVTAEMAGSGTTAAAVAGTSDKLARSVKAMATDVLGCNKVRRRLGVNSRSVGMCP